MPETPAAGGAPADDWAARLASTIERSIESVRSRTTEPVAAIVRWLAVGGALLLVGTALAVLVVILAGRLLAILPGPVWSAYGVAGGMILLAGVFVLRLRTPRNPA